MILPTIIASPDFSESADRKYEYRVSLGIRLWETHSIPSMNSPFKFTCPRVDCCIAYVSSSAHKFTIDSQKLPVTIVDRVCELKNDEGSK